MIDHTRDAQVGRSRGLTESRQIDRDPFEPGLERSNDTLPGASASAQGVKQKKYGTFGHPVDFMRLLSICLTQGYPSSSGRWDACSHLPLAAYNRSSVLLPGEPSETDHAAFG